MSMPPKPPERLAEILLELLALSDSKRTSQWESARDSDSIASTDTHGVNEDSQRRDEEDNKQQTP